MCRTFFILVQSHVSILVLIPWAIGVLVKKKQVITYAYMLQSLPSYSCSSFRVSGFTWRCLMLWSLYSYRSSFVLLHENHPFGYHDLLKKLSFLQCMFLVLCQISDSCSCMVFFLCLYSVVLVFMLFLLLLFFHIIWSPPVLLLLFRIAFALQKELKF
jgi:hypothetical protein